jgi:hypothetical protein
MRRGTGRPNSPPPPIHVRVRVSIRRERRAYMPYTLISVYCDFNNVCSLQNQSAFTYICARAFDDRIYFVQVYRLYRIRVSVLHYSVFSYTRIVCVYGVVPTQRIPTKLYKNKIDRIGKHNPSRVPGADDSSVEKYYSRKLCETYPLYTVHTHTHTHTFIYKNVNARTHSLALSCATAMQQKGDLVMIV